MPMRSSGTGHNKLRKQPVYKTVDPVLRRFLPHPGIVERVEICIAELAKTSTRPTFKALEMAAAQLGLFDLRAVHIQKNRKAVALKNAAMAAYRRNLENMSLYQRSSD
jgi:hypothetical protein